MLLKDASKLYAGGSAVSKVYAGSNLVWPVAAVPSGGQPRG